ncbi:hypothetical protein TNCV_4685031 [Trichonephila clavipes]|nr:hypothetical protein TNCV_4685031 [Trichonephila clavipes]
MRETLDNKAERNTARGMFAISRLILFQIRQSLRIAPVHSRFEISPKPEIRRREELGPVIEDDDDTNGDSENELSLQQKLRISDS